MQELKNTPIFFIDVCVGVDVVHPRFFFHSNTFASLVWISRESAFYVFITGARDVFKVKSPDEVFDTLERLLWDHANKVWNVEAASNFCSMRFGIEIS